MYFNILKNVNNLINQAAGTVIKYLTRGMIEKISFLNPNEDILRKFNIINKNIYNKLELLNKQNEIEKVLDEYLPDTYGKDVFNRKTDIILTHILEESMINNRYYKI
ncbi:hypothetical protein [Peptostreptococcus russellii]|uniref:hypothetical protein n=1 Tax=Peptostreptococcus russellii TaxID=215200 RepID=UPI003F58397E